MIFTKIEMEIFQIFKSAFYMNIIYSHLFNDKSDSVSDFTSII